MGSKLLYFHFSVIDFSSSLPNENRDPEVYPVVLIQQETNLLLFLLFNKFVYMNACFYSCK